MGDLDCRFAISKYFYLSRLKCALALKSVATSLTWLPFRSLPDDELNVPHMASHHFPVDRLPPDPTRKAAWKQRTHFDWNIPGS